MRQVKTYLSIIWKTLDYVFPVLLMGVYVMFRLGAIPSEYTGDIYFIATSIGLGFFMYKNAERTNNKLLVLLTTQGSLFFLSLAGLFIYYWVILNDRAIWVYKAMIVGFVINIIVLIIKYVRK